MIDARKRGMKPANLLIVSLIGKTGEANHTIYANPSAEYDWRWMVGLDACLYVRAGIDWKRTAMAIARTRPHWFGVYDPDQFKGADVFALPHVDDIAKPQAQWRWKLDFLPWLQFQNEQFAWAE